MKRGTIIRDAVCQFPREYPDDVAHYIEPYAFYSKHRVYCHECRDGFYDPDGQKRGDQRRVRVDAETRERFIVRTAYENTRSGSLSVDRPPVQADEAIPFNGNPSRGAFTAAKRALVEVEADFGGWPAAVGEPADKTGADLYQWKVIVPERVVSESVKVTVSTPVLNTSPGGQRFGLPKFRSRLIDMLTGRRTVAAMTPEQKSFGGPVVIDHTDAANDAETGIEEHGRDSLVPSYLAGPNKPREDIPEAEINPDKPFATGALIEPETVSAVDATELRKEWGTNAERKVLDLFHAILRRLEGRATRRDARAELEAQLGNGELYLMTLRAATADHAVHNALPNPAETSSGFPRTTEMKAAARRQAVAHRRSHKT